MRERYVMSSATLTYSVPLAVGNALSIAVNIYAVYLLTCVADNMFSKYRTLLIASTVCPVEIGPWSRMYCWPETDCSRLSRFPSQSLEIELGSPEWYGRPSNSNRFRPIPKLENDIDSEK